MRVKNWDHDESITINLSSIRLSGASWNLTGVNLIIQDSYLNNFKLKFSGGRVYTNKQRQYHSNLTFVNTFYSYSNFTGLNSLICLKKANAVFVNTTIRNIQRVKVLAIIRATLNSSVNFLKSYIVAVANHNFL